MKGFNHAVNGYNVEEVNNFLDQVIKKVEGMISEDKKKDLKIKELETKLENFNSETKKVLDEKDKKIAEYESMGDISLMKAKLEQYARMEETLQNAIIMAQKTSDQMRLTAHQERETIIEEARKNANRIINEALLESEKPERTSVCILTDKEEIGSIGSTGAESVFFENCVAELIDAQEGYNDLKLRHALENSRMLSSDVSIAFDPNYPSVSEPKNTAYFGKGISFNKYTGSGGKSGSSDAPAEYVAKIRKVLDDNDVMFQFAELGKVDQGGGGTIAYVLANKNMDVIDAGIPVQNMHAPYETASKGDLYEAYRAYKAFLKDMK